MTRRCALSPWARAAVLAVASQVAASQVHTVQTWDGSAEQWTVAGADLRGLLIERTGQPDIVPWNRVRSVEGPAAGEVEPYLELGETAWRAVSRLERGDAYGAEPLFENAFERLRGAEGPTAAVVAEGLLRCRLRRDARAAAVEAWLDLYGNLAAAPTTEPLWNLRSPAIDEQSLLAPALPPVWFAGPAARAFAERSEAPASPDDVTGAVRSLYAAAARHALGDPVDADVTSRAVSIAARRESADLVAQMVIAQVGGEQARRDARLMLERQRSPSGEPWRRVWATIAIGRSLTREADTGVRRRGVLELISLHALDRDVSPYLAGLALADASLAAESLGDRDTASALLEELARTMPTHPVWDGDALNELADTLPGRVSNR